VDNGAIPSRHDVLRNLCLFVCLVPASWLDVCRPTVVLPSFLFRMAVVAEILPWCEVFASAPLGFLGKCPVSSLATISVLTRLDIGMQTARPGRDSYPSSPAPE
jgi:hypothetical protein